MLASSHRCQTCTNGICIYSEAFERDFSQLRHPERELRARVRTRLEVDKRSKKKDEMYHDSKRIIKVFFFFYSNHHHSYSFFGFIFDLLVKGKLNNFHFDSKYL